MDQFVNYIIENNQHLVLSLAAIISMVCLVWFIVIYRSVKLDVINPATKNIQSLKLKEDLNKKNKELERMKHRLELQQKKLSEAKTGGGEDSELLGSLKSEVQDLKEKLSDYEIIEDDIANLSKYKNENEKLLEKLSKYEPSDKPEEELVKEKVEEVSAKKLDKKENKEKEGDISPKEPNKEVPKENAEKAGNINSKEAE